MFLMAWNKHSGLAQVARMDSITSPLKDVVPPHFECGAEYTHGQKKPVPNVVRLEPAT